MDVHVPYAVTIALRLNGVDVLTAQEDNSRELEDASLLDRATALGRILFTRDDDLLREGALRQKRGESFAGIIYAHQLDVSIGQCVIDLELVAKASDSEMDWSYRVLAAEVTHSTRYLPFLQHPCANVNLAHRRCLRMVHLAPYLAA